jgi:hypothetical protein
MYVSRAEGHHRINECIDLSGEFLHVNVACPIVVAAP